jgi:GT2 family glycosyltransferase
VVVDNGARASNEGWDLAPPHQLHVDSAYLGSEGAFRVGAELISADPPSWTLLLDHDAGLKDATVALLLAAATKPRTVYSANQGGHGGGWNRWHGIPESTRPDELELAPWSGLLLPPDALPVLVDQHSGYFFGRDDYLFSWRLHSAGFQLVGVPAAVVRNDRREGDYLAPWRAYYAARNHLLFVHDVDRGQASRDRLTALQVWSKMFAGALTHRQWGRANAIAKGVVDGVRGRRGMTIPPR